MSRQARFRPGAQPFGGGPSPFGSWLRAGGRSGPGRLCGGGGWGGCADSRWTLRDSNPRPAGCRVVEDRSPDEHAESPALRCEMVDLPDIGASVAIDHLVQGG